MSENDTVKLLRDCDAGLKMGLSSIKEVMEFIHSESLKNVLDEALSEHRELAREIEDVLARYGDDGKDPNPIVSGMSSIKTNMKLIINESDKTVADLMTDGCNMGVKSIAKYLNEYKTADEDAKHIANKLIDLEERMCKKLRGYL